MAVNGQMTYTAVLPRVLLIHAYADQVRHNIGEALVVISLDPNYFQVAFRIGQLADISQKFPMFLGQPAEIEVGENIAQQDQASETILLQHASGLARAAGVRSQMDVGKDQRIVDGRIHTLFLARECYGTMK